MGLGGVLAGQTNCSWGQADCNPPVPNLRGQFRSLRDHGDVMGFHRAASPGVILSKHWQGFQRLMIDRGRYAVVPRSGAGVSWVLVKIASRTGGGERWRSNRIGATSHQVRPPATDQIVKTIRSDSGFDHSGGGQSVGSFLAVGLEEGSKSKVAFWDLFDPTRPARRGTLTHATGVKGAGTVSMARLRDGQILLIVGGADANVLDFYVSRPGSTLKSPAFDFAATWRDLSASSDRDTPERARSWRGFRRSLHRRARPERWRGEDHQGGEAAPVLRGPGQ